MFDLALGIFLLLSPVIIMLGHNARINGSIMALQFYQFKTFSTENNILQLQFFEYGIVLLFIIALMQKPIRYFKDKYITYFLGLCALSVFIHPKTLMSFLLVFLGCLFYYLVMSYAKNVKKLLYPIVIVSTLNTLFAVLQFFGINWIYKIINISGCMFTPSHLGTYQALAFPICYAINPYLSIIPLIGILLSKSITPIVALLVGMVYLWFPQRKKIFVNLAPMGFTALLGIFIVLFVRNYKYIFYKFILRLGIWSATIKEIFFRPFIGFGLGTFSELSDKFYSKLGHWGWAYNEYLEIAFCVGVLVWFIIYLFLMDKFKKIGIGLERNIAASCLIVAIICLGQSTLHFARLIGTIIPLFAFLEILKRKEGVPLK